ncbi:MAG: hypothetical protein II347_03835, partial [Lachnospiraceae bacterium]|nr:hypothetical protein [Lachnospiraceae bacterium]
MHWNQNGYGKYCPRCNKVHIHGWEYEWGGGREYWYSHDVTDPAQVIDGYGFTSGDWRTWTDLLDPDYRLADGAAKILSMYGKDGFGFESNSVNITTDMVTNAQNGLKNDAYYPKNDLTDSKNLFGAEGRWLRFVSEFYQDSVADADVITLALGNTNFGTFMFDTIKDIFLNPTAKNWFPSRYHIKEVYLMAKRVGVDDEMMAMIKQLINDELNPILNEQFGDLANEPLPETVVDGSAVDPYGLLTNYGGRTKGALVKYIVEYCVLSYVVNYVASIERIVELNPDAKIIQIALMNAYKTENASTETTGLDFAAIIDQIYGPMNAFIAMMPNYLANKNPDKYDEATFYYSDTGTVETLSAVFGNDFYTYNGGAITYDEYQTMLANNTLNVTKLGHNDSTVRERFHHWLASTQGCYDNRAHANGAENCTYCKGYLTYYYLYVEMQRNPGAGTGWGWGDVTSYGEMWKGLLARLECNFPDTLTVAPSNVNSGYYSAYTEWLNAKNAGSDMSDTSLIKKFFNEYRLTYVTEADIIAYENMSLEARNNLLNGPHSYARDKAFSCAMYLAFEDATIRAGKNAFKIDDLTSVSGLGYDTFGGAVELFAQKMGLNGINVVGVDSALTTIDANTLTKNLSDALVEYGPSATMLCLANRMQIGTGIGGHPSEGGHNTMAAAIIRDYQASNTGDAAVKAFALSYLKNKYPNLMNKLSGAQGMGQMDDLAIIISMLKLSKNDALAGVDLDALETSIRGALRAFEESKTPAEQAAAKADVAALMRLLYTLAAKITGSKYAVAVDSFYVSLGDSNVTGYGLDGYVENEQHGILQLVEGSAPVQLAKMFFGENWKSHFGQYAQGALRAEDMLYILGVDNGIVLDSYYYDEIQGNLLYKNDITATRKEYYDIIKKADLISINVGGGNVTTFTGEQVDRVLAGETLVKMDWTKIGYNSTTLAELDAFLDEMVPLVDTLGLMNKYLPEGMESVKNPAKFARVLLESMLYGYASYNYYYPQVIDRIREINP